MKEWTMKQVKKVITPRDLQSHKGSYGRVLLVGGTYPYGGAIIMVALATVHSGAGLVTVATDRENIVALHSHLPEAMAFDLTEDLRLREQVKGADVVLAGPGLAEDEKGLGVLEAIFQEIKDHQVLILDGGALNLIGKEALPFPKKGKVIVTPHQKEWERLSGVKMENQTEMENQRALNHLPSGTILVHKKVGTELYQSGKSEVYRMNVGGPHQATGGMGDTLAGMIAGFVAQFERVSLYERVATAVYAHSAIADELAKNHYVTLPTQISREISRWMRTIVENRSFIDGER